MRFGMLVGLALAFVIAAPGMVRAEQREEEREGERQEEEDEKLPTLQFKLVHHINASKIGFNKRGRCKAIRGRPLKAWRVKRFPVQIPHFETCLTVSSKKGRGLMDFELSVVDKNGEAMAMVEGAIDLGHQGQASQAVDWDHLEIPAAGLYHMRLLIEDQQVAKIPLRFKRKRK
jgi:hypothetical protein